MENMNWAIIIAAIISLIGSIITIYSSRNVQKKSQEISKKASEIQEKLSDKQRIVENIGAQRIEWIGKIRDIFIDYNYNLNRLIVTVRQLEKVKNSPLVDELELIFYEINKSYNKVYLLLNPTEPYTRYLLKMMIKVNSIDQSLVVDNRFFEMKERIKTIQNVILKVEWKRVKEETVRGEFLSAFEVDQLFQSVGKQMDYELHNIIMGNYRKLD